MSSVRLKQMSDTPAPTDNLIYFLFMICRLCITKVVDVDSVRS